MSYAIIGFVQDEGDYLDIIRMTMAGMAAEQLFLVAGTAYLEVQDPTCTKRRKPPLHLSGHS